ncbi:MAG: AbrB/MazE/SpoVT family DNA-binding domain-containing protein [Candidatus Pacebacteria bacterium]|nr:AbrB/MazE/SpoVT family DNA-binding domain-containing protein [Candidatus Paceibacterota bacterium]
MTTKIQKWGNSLAVRIPNEFAKNLNWSEGAVVGFQQLGNKMIITSSRPKYTVEQMLKGMTKKSLHKSLWLNDKSRGKEIW